MQVQRFDLADLLTAAGSAVGCTNLRLAQSGAPALLREFTLGVNFSASFRLSQDAGTVLFTKVSPPAPVLAGVAVSAGNVTIEALYVAAPRLDPPPEGVP